MIRAIALLYPTNEALRTAATPPLQEIRPPLRPSERSFHPSPPPNLPVSSVDPPLHILSKQAEGLPPRRAAK